MTKKKFYYLRVGILVAFAVAFSAITANVAVAEYPDKPITFIVPYSPGGGSDQQARRLQPGLEKALGVKITLERVNQNDLQARITSSIQSGSGPDIVQLVNNHPHLYAASMVDCSDVAEEIGAAQGGLSLIHI